MLTKKNLRKCGQVLFELTLGVALLSLAFSSARAGWQEEWEKTLSAAKKEGRLAVSYHGTKARRDVILKFQEVYPDIRVEPSSETRKYTPRVRAERKVGIYSTDIRIGGPRTNHRLIPEGVYASLRPLIILPEILDDSKWLGGYLAGFSDRDKKISYSPFANRTGNVDMNLDFVSYSVIKTVDDLLNPKLKGKITMRDPRHTGSGNTVTSTLLRARGKEFLREFLLKQQPIFSRKNRQVAEWLARGRYPIAVGLGSVPIDSLKKEGVGLSIKRKYLPAMFVTSFGGSTVAFMDRAPHPNAAKVFVNWYLSRQGQITVSRILNTNSRRLDVPVVDPVNHLTIEQFETLFRKDYEENASYAKNALKVAREILK